MLRNLIFAVVLSFTLVQVGCNKDNHYRDTQGHKINFSQQQGRWIVLNYWASWCGYCVKKVPQLNAFYGKHKDNVLMLGVNYDQLNGHELEQSVSAVGMEFPSVEGDPRQEFGYSRVTQIPTLIAISPKGEVLPPFQGDRAVLDLEEAIQKG